MWLVQTQILGSHSDTDTVLPHCNAERGAQMFLCQRGRRPVAVFPRDNREPRQKLGPGTGQGEAGGGCAPTQNRQ